MSKKFSSWISSLDCSLKLSILHTTVRHCLEVNIEFLGTCTLEVLSLCKMISLKSAFISTQQKRSLHTPGF